MNEIQQSIQRKTIENDKPNQHISLKQKNSSSITFIQAIPKLDKSDQDTLHSRRKIHLHRKTLDKRKNKHSYETVNEQRSSDSSFKQTSRKPNFRSIVMEKVSQTPPISLVQEDDDSYELEPGEIPLSRKDYEKLLDQCKQPYSGASLTVLNVNSEDFEEGEVNPNSQSSEYDSKPKHFGKICSW